ncbi:unnamed protein product [Acanthosepion pharaonis]|uniref:Uncharacterized protein n=1 Tax=Acanthosepion pharaonis TaxID=158019 RepID=A0A812DRM7_ACAPH|nr:unnamed protein product [Sepia pharaonis]
MREATVDKPSVAEEPPAENINDANQQSQEKTEAQRNEDLDNQREISDTNSKQEFVPEEFEPFFMEPKDQDLKIDFEFSYLPPAMFLPEQSYTSRRAYQMFSKYYNYIDNIDKLLDHTLQNIINNSKNPGDNTTDQDAPPEDAPVRALVRYLLSETMQKEMDRFLADL